MEYLEKMQEVLRDPSEMIGEWKDRGKKIVGYRCIYVPEEIIYASGMMPYPIFGTPEPISLADAYFQPYLCEFIRNIFDLALKGKLNFLDGLVLCNTCDAVRKLYDHWKTYIKTPLCYIINNPQQMHTDIAYNYYEKELRKFKVAMEKFSGREISNEALQKAIELYNETRALLKELYSLRKNDSPPISGTEALDVAMASMIMEKEQCNVLLKELIREIKERKEIPDVEGPRILVTGSIIDDPTLIHLVEESGGLVVADDLCTSMKYFWNEIETTNGDPLDAICRYNTERCLCACMHPQEKRFEYLEDLIKEFNVEGVIYFNMKFCDPFIYEGVIFRDKFKELGIPTLILESEHSLSGLGQLKTRIQAFIEMWRL